MGVNSLPKTVTRQRRECIDITYYLLLLLLLLLSPVSLRLQRHAYRCHSPAAAILIVSLTDDRQGKKRPHCDRVYMRDTSTRRSSQCGPYTGTVASMRRSGDIL